MNRFLRSLVPLLSIATFLAMDAALPTMPSWLSMVIFLPLRAVLGLMDLLQIHEELRILFTILFGIPLLFAYWYGIYLFVATGKLRPTDAAGKTESS